MLRSALRIATVSAGATLGALLVVSSRPSLQIHAVHASVATDRAAGRALFAEKGCEHCHGVDGIGGDKGPNLSGVGRTRKPAEISTQILHGGDAMPSFADVLTPDDVKLLVDYLAAKRKIVKTNAPVSPAASASKPDSGGSDDQ